MPSKHPLSHWLRNAWFILRNLILFALILLLVNGSAVPIGDLASQVRAYTHPMEFDFVTWTLDAFVVKLADWGFGVTHFLDPDAQTNLVREYLHQVQIVQDLTTNLSLTYIDPSVADPESAGRSLRQELTRAQARLDSLASLAETILQSQLMDIIAESDLAVLGQVLPPSLFRATTIPYSLILSPRTEINQVLDISLQPGMTVEVMEKLEESITTDLDYAALVVPIGGIGTYPTMVMQSTDLVWLTEVIAHEWVHNYLTLRPLGMNYYTTPELRTINETTASLVGEELGLLILKKYYPDWVPRKLARRSSQWTKKSLNLNLPNLITGRKCGSPVKRRTACYRKAKSPKRKPIWKPGEPSSGKMAMQSANSIRPICVLWSL